MKFDKSKNDKDEIQNVDKLQKKKMLEIHFGRNLNKNQFPATKFELLTPSGTPKHSQIVCQQSGANMSV